MWLMGLDAIIRLVYSFPDITIHDKWGYGVILS